MKFSTVAALAGTAAATPFSFPLKNGFPSLSNDALAQVQQQAGGTIPNTPLPKTLSPTLTAAFQLVAANEIFEVAYFTELYHNISTNVPGYECTEQERKFVEGAIYRIRAQEELHATGANAILKNAGQHTVGPCKYSFPVADFKSAIALANTFTDVVLGVLPVVQTAGASAGLIPLIGGIEEQEAEQVGWFRTLQEKFPSASPFLVPTTPEFALSAVKMFLVPGSCPAEYNALEQAIKSFPPLTVASAPTSDKQTASYSVMGNVAPNNAIAYISGQNYPVTVAVSNIKKVGGVTTFDAPFPAKAGGFSDGLTLAALVPTNKQFMNASDVAASTIFGPGLIEYN